MTVVQAMGSVPAVLAAIAARPRLWPVALGTARSLISRSWWRRRPFLPIPDRQWLRFRIVTAYGGDGTAAISADDVIAFLEWKRTFPR